MKTRSEIRFEAYCVHRGYNFTRIILPDEFGRRADYRLHSPAGDVVCEVKEIENNEWDSRSADGGDASRSIGTRARAMIKNAAEQLRNHREEKIPLIVFGLDRTTHGYLSDYDIDAGMFGELLVRFHLDGKAPNDERSSFGHGGSRQMTKDTRRYISAMCVLDAIEPKLKIYHNPFSDIALYPRYFPHQADIHYIKDGHPDNAGHGWLEYTGLR